VAPVESAAIQQSESPRVAEGAKDGSRWKDVIGVAVGVVTVGGALVYGLLALGYGQFYRELGIRPRDVGVEFGKTFADSAGVSIALVIVALIGSVLVVGLAWFLRLILLWPKRRVLLRARRRRPEALWRVLWRNRPLVFKLRFFLWTFVALSLLAYLSTAGVLLWVGNTYADDVKKGELIQPFRIPYLGLEMLSVRADPVARITTRAGGEVQPEDLGQEIAKRRLYYLGQSGGVLVLYDALHQHDVFLSAGSTSIEARNCETRLNTEAACEKDSAGH
jgi:hypothetical protein